jgi:hypothetical protein
MWQLIGGADGWPLGAIWPFLFWIMFWGGLFWRFGVFGSGFHLIDDHRLVEISDELSAPNARFSHVLSDWLHGDLAEGRFRPLYVISRVLRAEWFGLSWPTWTAYNVALAALTGGLLSVFALLAGFCSLSALTLAAFAMLGPPATVWWRLGTPETEANALAALALCLFAFSARQPGGDRRADAVAVLASLLASLHKEGMVLFLPSLAAFRVWLPCRSLGTSLSQSLRESSWIVATIALVFTCELAALLWLVGSRGTGYAGVDAATFHVSALRPALLGFAAMGKLWVPALASIIVSALWIAGRGAGSRGSMSTLWVGWSVFLIGAVPQVLLYTKSGWAEHYWNPVMISAAFIAVLAVETLRPRQVLLYLIGIALLIQPLKGRERWTREHLAEYAADGRALSQLLDAARDCAGSARPVLIVANPRAHYEEAASLRTHLRRRAIYLASVGSVGAEIPSDAFEDQERQRAYLNPATLAAHYFAGNTLMHMRREQGKEPGAIIMLDVQKSGPPFDAATADWLDTTDWARLRVTLAAIPTELRCPRIR